MWTWIGFAGVAMSLGWGLRGYIGGGPLGAMIPGAMVALVLCLLLRRDGSDAAVIAAFGAVSVGFGGQMTYGQTIGLTLQTETMAWGLLGLWLKGAIWGLLGAACIGIALVRDRYRRSDILVALSCMLAANYAGWKLVNQPKLIYFSNRLDRPREEVWAGLLFGAIALLACLWRKNSSRIPHYFAGAGFVGGGAGFLLGGWIQMMGRTHWPNPLVDWWKGMEFTFGLLFGIALGWSAWRHRETLRQVRVIASRERNPMMYAGVALLILASTLEVLPFTLLGALLLVLSLHGGMISWHVAGTLTAAAFYFDLLGTPLLESVPNAWIGPLLASILTALLIERYPRAMSAFQVVMIAAVADSLVKSALQPARPAHLYVEAVFCLMTIAVWAFVWHLRERSENSRRAAAATPSLP